MGCRRTTSSTREVAYSAYKNKCRKSGPYVKSPFLKLDNQAYRLEYLLLRIPTTARHFIYLTLNGSLYHRSFLADKSLKLGSVTITERSVLIAFSKEVALIEPRGRMGISMENLKGIRKLYRKGNRTARSFRGRMNSWMFREIQRQIEYKAVWDGIPVEYVNARGTSRNCPDCGSRVVPLQDRKLYCAQCDRLWDRDDLASKNIMAAPLVHAARPPVCSGEGEPRRQKAGNPPSRRVEGESLGLISQRHIRTIKVRGVETTKGS